MIKKFDNGKLKKIDGKRAKDRKFPDIEDKLISYNKLRTKNYKQDKCITSWLLLWEKCVKWAVNIEIENLKCSYGWISDTLRHHELKRITLHGDKNDTKEEEYEKVIIPLRKY